MTKALAQSAREVCGFVKVRRKNLKSEWWNKEVKAGVERKETS